MVKIDSLLNMGINDTSPAETAAEDVVENKKEVSPQVAEQLSKYDEAIRGREGVIRSLGVIAKEDIYAGDAEAEKTIKQKESGQFSLDDEVDSVAYKEAGLGLQLKRMFGLGKKDSVQTAHRGLLDKREFNQAAVGNEYDLGKKEQEKVRDGLVQDGLAAEDVVGMEFTKNYKEVDGQIIKTIERTRTEEEMQKAAEKLLVEDLARLQTVDGANLIKNKEALERHNKNKVSLKELSADLDEKTKGDIMEKLAKEEESAMNAIKEQAEMLDKQLEKYRTPLTERLTGINEMAAEFTGIFNELKGREEIFLTQAKNFEAKIKQAGKLELLGGVGADLMKALAERRDQNAVDLAALKSRRETIQNRLEALKKDKQETEKILERINNIGKTKTEIKIEKDQAKKKKEEPPVEPKPPVPEGGAGEAGTINTAEAPADDSESDNKPPVKPETPEDGGTPPADSASKENAVQTEGRPAVAGKKGEKPVETASVEGKAEKEKELVLTKGAVVEKLIKKYATQEKDRKATEACFASKNEKGVFMPNKVIKEGEIKARLNNFCLQVLKINGIEDRKNKITEIITFLKSNI
jgi:hypothetical protein